MIIGIPKEIKQNENRVALPPLAVEDLVRSGHTVLMEKNAGTNSGFSDEEYLSAGADVKGNASEVWNGSEMIIKVKEPVPSEYTFFREGLVLFTFLHLAANPELAHALLQSRTIALAYETLQLKDGSLPLLVPMSEIAGRIGAQEAACLLKKNIGGKGLLIGGTTGVPPAKVVILGAGISGRAAASVCVGMGARVTMLDINLNRLREIEHLFHGKIETCYAGEYNIKKFVSGADVVIGCVLVAGAKAPKVVTRQMLKTMSQGSVLVDIAIDQGGCFETSRPTTHDHPTYMEEEIVHYCVTNMPGSVPHTSTMALSNATLPYIKKIAESGLIPLIASDDPVSKSVNTLKGKLTNAAVAEALQMEYVPIEFLIRS